nr:MAG TPA: hypothetical protein [Caudoviricetes sp.]
MVCLLFFKRDKAKSSILHAICKIEYRKGEHRSRSMLPLV